MNMALIIPAYNALSTLPRLLQNAGQIFDKRHILVIDDGSTDDTAAAAQDAGANLIRHPQNRGKGAALRTGFNWALEQDYEAIITMDADGDFYLAWEDSISLTEGQLYFTTTLPVVNGSRAWRGYQ